MGIYGVVEKNMEFKMKIQRKKFHFFTCSEKDKKEEGKEQQPPETETETIKRLKKELAVKDFLIDDLS